MPCTAFIACIAYSSLCSYHCPSVFITVFISLSISVHITVHQCSYHCPSQCSYHCPSQCPSQCSYHCPSQCSSLCWCLGQRSEGAGSRSPFMRVLTAKITSEDREGWSTTGEGSHNLYLKSPSKGRLRLSEG